MEATNFIVHIWSGSGYMLDEFNVNACCEEHALEVLAARMIKEDATTEPGSIWYNGGRFYLTEKEMQQAIKGGYMEVLDDEYNEVYGWIYIDATMEGAPYPVWIRTENMRIQSIA